MSPGGLPCLWASGAILHMDSWVYKKQQADNVLIKPNTTFVLFETFDHFLLLSINIFIMCHVASSHTYLVFSVFFLIAQVTSEDLQVPSS